MRNRLLGLTIEQIKNIDCDKKFIRVEEAAKLFNQSEEEIRAFALAASARYQLHKIQIIRLKKLEEYMRHLYKVPNENKYVNKRFAKVKEAIEIYSIGRHRIIDLARAAGAVYKIGNAILLINLEILDDYLEQFKEPAISMKNPLWTKGEEK